MKKRFYNYWAGKHRCDGFDREQFNHDVKQFYAYLSTLTSYPVQGSHSFKDGQEVIEGKDYCIKLNENVEVEFAIPLPTPAPVAEQEKMYSRKDMEDCFNNSRLQFKMDDTFCYETFNDYIKTLNQKS
jgi:hypothetical protein